ncbi:MAG: hypothetical protein NT124_04750 [Candidatus Dependentiae bacterium]|nr:hypothetical protein [Candidatus Dependentiae bacterium]
MKRILLFSTLSVVLCSFSYAKNQSEVSFQEQSETESLSEYSSEVEESYAIDKLDFFEEEATVEEFMQNIVNILINILSTQTDISKEALNAYIAQQLTELIANNKVTIKISVSSQKRQAPQKPGYDEETKVVIGNFADMVSSFFSIVKDPNNSGNVAVNLTSMFANVVNIALLATKSGNLNPEAVELFTANHTDTYVQAQAV